MSVTVDLARCDGNAECVKACAFAAIEVHDRKAQVFENCTECGACVLACTPQAIWSDLFSRTTTSSVLAVDFGPTSGIAAQIERAAKRADAALTWMIADPVDAGGAADAISATFTDREGGYAAVVLPHEGAGPAIAGRAAARIGATLLTGCSELKIDETGEIRALRPRFGGVVQVQTRIARGAVVATLYPRGVQRIAAAPLEQRPVEKVDAGERPRASLMLTRRIVAVGSRLSAEAEMSARAIAEALGATFVDNAAIAGENQPLSPDLYVAAGIDGGTEHNALFRNSRVVVVMVSSPDAPIAQIADYLLVGDIEEHLKALVALL